MGVTPDGSLGTTDNAVGRYLKLSTVNNNTKKNQKKKIKVRTKKVQFFFALIKTGT